MYECVYVFLFKIDSQYSKEEVGKNTSIKYRFHCIWRFQVCPKLFLILFKNNTKINCSGSSRKCFIDKIEEGRNEKEEQEMAKLSEHPRKEYTGENYLSKRVSDLKKNREMAECNRQGCQVAEIIEDCVDCLCVLLNAER